MAEARRSKVSALAKTCPPGGSMEARRAASASSARGGSSSGLTWETSGSDPPAATAEAARSSRDSTSDASVLRRASYSSLSRLSTAARSLATATTPNATSATLGSSMPQSSQTKALRNSMTSEVSALGAARCTSVGVRCAPRMARKDRQKAPGVSATQPQTPLGKARWALEAGDVRRARQLAAEAARSGPEAERAEAQALLDRLGPDLAALLTAAAVLVLIVFAAWAAILRGR